MNNEHQQENIVASRMRGLAWAGAFLGFVLVVAMGYSMWQASVRRDVEQLPVIRAVPAFSLVDQNGQTVTNADLRGKIWIADFVFTRCKGPCPLMTARMLEMQKALVKTPEVKLVSVTVDPAHDTPEVLKAYAEANFADPNRWKFLTGDQAVIEKLVTEGFMQHLSCSIWPKKTANRSTAPCSSWSTATAWCAARGCWRIRS